MKTTIEPNTPDAPKLGESGHNPLLTTYTASDHHPSSKIHHPTVARLPKSTRDMLNVMLDDGLPYHVIVDELAEAGRGVTPQSLAQWLQTGYEDYLKNRDQIEQAKTQAEFAADLLKELGGIDFTTIHRACLALAAIQMFTAIDEYGDEALRKMLQTKPTSWISLVNTLCNTVQPMIDLENHRLASESKAGAKTPTAPHEPTLPRPT